MVVFVKRHANECTQRPQSTMRGTMIYAYWFPTRLPTRVCDTVAVAWHAPSTAPWRVTMPMQAHLGVMNNDKTTLSAAKTTAHAAAKIEARPWARPRNTEGTRSRDWSAATRAKAAAVEGLEI
jgi:hypothetical protein